MNRVQITCNMLRGHVVWSDSTAIEFDRVYIIFILALLCWLKRLTSEGGEKTGVPGENP